MFKRFGVLFIAAGTALILNVSVVTAQTRSGGNWGGRNGNNVAQPSYPITGSQPNGYQAQQGAGGYNNSRDNYHTPQQQYAPNGGRQQLGYANGYQAGQGSYGYEYSRGDSYAAPDYRSYE